MTYFINTLFLICYFLCYKRKATALSVLVLIYTFVFLYEIFGAFFFSFTPEVHLNLWLLLFGVLYFSLWFFSFYWLSVLGTLGAVVHSMLMILISITKIAIPLHPLILLYPDYKDYLPAFNYPIINLFLIFFIFSLIFCKSNRYIKFAFILSFFSFPHFFNNISNSNNPNTKLAIIQVGLYYEKGGNTTDFFSDMHNFLRRNPGVDTIIFSENNLYSYKNRYNEELTEELIKDISTSKLNEQYNLLLSFSAFRDINNIITYYYRDDIIRVNQKRVLIPFIESSGFLNRKQPMHSKYYYVHDNIINERIDLIDYTISTQICYDALFPELLDASPDVVVIQSNYKLLDRGYGHDKLKIYATYLAKFLNGVNGSIVINVQNHGGTVILSDDWEVDHETFLASKMEPFIIIDLKKYKQ